jgi:hypothetical protein
VLQRVAFYGFVLLLFYYWLLFFSGIPLQNHVHVSPVGNTMREHVLMQIKPLRGDPLNLLLDSVSLLKADKRERGMKQSQHTV